MKKTFISTISLQGKNDLKQVYYEPIGFSLETNKLTNFPIIPIIASNIVRGDDIQIIVIRIKNSDVQDNYAIFLKELNELGISEDQIETILLEEDQRNIFGINMLMELLQLIAEDSLIYADITFGTKPMSALTLYAMNMIEKLKDTEVKGIYYGELPRRNSELKGNAKIYELTAYKYLSDMVEQLNNLQINDSLGAVKRLLDI